jgi:signal transduction histidine kinase
MIRFFTRESHTILTVREPLAASTRRAWDATVASAIRERRLDVQNVVVSVADSGAGLSPEAQSRLFDAFWSTQADGVGSGLTISRTIVEAQGRRIWMTPRPSGAML